MQYLEQGNSEPGRRVEVTRAEGRNGEVLLDWYRVPFGRVRKLWK